MNEMGQKMAENFNQIIMLIRNRIKQKWEKIEKFISKYIKMLNT